MKFRDKQDQVALVRGLIDQKINEMDTALLCKVAAVTPGENLIEVELLAKRSYLDENNKVQYQQFDNINVHLAYQKGFKSVTKVGDYGIVLVMQSDITWYTDNEPDSVRKYDRLDGIFIPMQYGDVNTVSMTVTSDTGENILINSGADLEVTATKFKFSNGTDELIDLVSQAMGVCESIVVNTSTGDLDSGIKSQFTDIKNKLEAFKV